MIVMTMKNDINDNENDDNENINESNVNNSNEMMIMIDDV